MKTVVWIQTINSNVLTALYPTNDGFFSIGYVIEDDGKFVAVSYRNPNSSQVFTSKQDAADYLIRLAELT